MRRFLELSLLSLAAGVGSACAPEKFTETEDIPTAGIRFVHAVPDTGVMDLRPVDIVENSHFYEVTFRSTTLLYYKPARAGARHFKVFMGLNTNLRNALTAEQQVTHATTVVEDLNVNLEAGKNYTFLIQGNMRTGGTPAKQFVLLEDNPADPGAQVAMRVVNTTDAAIDVEHYPASGAATGTPQFNDVAALSASAYLNANIGSIRFNVKPGAGGANLFADATALAGAPANGPGGKTCPPDPSNFCDRDALPGTTVAGSGVSAFVFPRSAVPAGTAATGFGTNFTTPGIVFVWDRRPPRLCDHC
jgi:hypothetical protein